MEHSENLDRFTPPSDDQLSGLTELVQSKIAAVFRLKKSRGERIGVYWSYQLSNQAFDEPIDEPHRAGELLMGWVQELETETSRTLAISTGWVDDEHDTVIAETHTIEFSKGAHQIIAIKKTTTDTVVFEADDDVYEHIIERSPQVGLLGSLVEFVKVEEERLKTIQQNVLADLELGACNAQEVQDLHNMILAAEPR